MWTKKTLWFCSIFVSVAMCSCVNKPSPGPDKQFAGTLEGAITGAGSGMVTGFQFGVGTGPGAAVGAGVGAVAGGIQGFAQDSVEDDLLKTAAKTQTERMRAAAQNIIAENYKRQLELHPTREIYPADVFFADDDVELSTQGKMVLRELAKIDQERLPWSRFIVASYVRANDKDSVYARYLAEKRSQNIGNFLVGKNFESRRVLGRAVVIEAPIVIDPDDSPERFNQAIEFIPMDR